MTTALQAAAQAAAKIPAYCSSGSGVRTPAQWAECVKAGWQESTTNAANAGFSLGHGAAPLIGIAIIVLLIALAMKSRPRAAAASKS